MKEIFVKHEYTKEGVVTTIVIPYEHRKCIELPKSCAQCPVGFEFINGETQASCGRNIPWTEIDYQQRPETCKLSKINIQDLL